MRAPSPQPYTAEKLATRCPPRRFCDLSPEQLRHALRQMLWRRPPHTALPADGVELRPALRSSKCAVDGQVASRRSPSAQQAAWHGAVLPLGLEVPEGDAVRRIVRLPPGPQSVQNTCAGCESHERRTMYRRQRLQTHAPPVPDGDEEIRGNGDHGDGEDSLAMPALPRAARPKRTKGHPVASRTQAEHRTPGNAETRDRRRSLDHAHLLRDPAYHPRHRRRRPCSPRRDPK